LAHVASIASKRPAGGELLPYEFLAPLAQFAFADTRGSAPLPEGALERHAASAKEPGEEQ
jgi:hypothetical protein